MATAQKRGFRFPWGGDSRREEPEVTDGPSLAERLGAVADDLGRGPFDLPEGQTPDQAAEAQPVVTAPAASPRLVVRAPNAEPMVIAAPAPAPEAAKPDATEPEVTAPEVTALEAAAPDAPEPTEDAMQAVAPAPATEDVQTEPEAEPQREAEPEAAAATAEEAELEASAPSAWPDADRRASRPTTPGTKAAPNAAGAEARRANPLVAGLVRAMREAARTAHDEAVATLRVDVAARTEAIREHGTAMAAELKKAADADVLSIREWSKAEMTRVREETESKIAARKVQLVAETEREARDTDALLGRLTAAVEAFEAETESFFKTLLAEEDPGRLAGLAEQLPPPPSLDEFPALGSVASEHGRSRTGRGPSPMPQPVGEPDDSPDDAPERSGEDGSAADGLDADAAAAAEAEALIGLDEKTQLVVSGLTSVAAIAGFKGELLNSPGVSAVSVNAGSDGDVLITVTHAADADMRRALRDIEAFQPAVVADDGTTLVVVAREPAG